MADKLTLSVLSQEKKLLEQEVDSVTVPSTTGEITLLPNHIPLLSSLQTGELIYRVDGTEQSIVVSQGFLDMSPDNSLTIMVDTATHARDISEETARKAMDQAKETMATSTDRHELLMAEASLKQAMWEIKVAQKTRKTQI